MRCFACDNMLGNAQPDIPTGRYYCSDCFCPTTEEQLRIAGKDYYDDIYIEVEVQPVEVKDSDKEDYENF